MIDVKINSASFSFIGLFPYEKPALGQVLNQQVYEPFDFYSNNKGYFDQKYYSNWIHSLFSNSEKNKVPHHLKLKKDSALFEKQLNLVVDGDEGVINFSIREVNVFFFADNLGIFVIKIDLPKPHHNWKDIVRFGSTFRQSTINEKYEKAHLSVLLIEEFIASKFHSDARSWRQYNPLLKSAIFVDIGEQLAEESLNKLLYLLGTYSMPFDDNDIYEPDEDYYKGIVYENGISIFKNWKALCLYDSVCRIAVNLNSVDRHKLWEDEYILIYIYTLYARYFLHYLNNQLISLFNDGKLLTEQRDRFYKFKNEFNHTKISYKFLPNVIYEKFKKTLDLEEEVLLIEEKLTRLSLLKQEKYQRRMNRILFMLTLLTLISVAYDGGQMLQKWEWSQSLKISIFIVVASFIIMVSLFYSKTKNK